MVPMLRSSGLVALFSFFALSACGPGESVEASATFVGRNTCSTCHEAETKLHAGSHHDLAMDVADESTVLGNFDDVSFEHLGESFEFRRDGEAYVVDTADATGEAVTFQITHVFGVYPLQQYLIEFPDGRLQALAAAWDSRAEEAGGQRWFHVYQDEPIPPGDALHWTGPAQNWNFMCADCHSTSLERNYDPRTDTFATSYTEMDVSCEACHGPGSHHAEWARGERKDNGKKGLTHLLRDLSEGKWEMDPETGNARRTHPRVDRVQEETCARCHSRRGVIHEAPAMGQPLLDDFRLSLLEEGLYHPDGQILDEVYVYGSFLQSKMYAEGVGCTDCHEPHTSELLYPGNQLCARCHTPEKYDSFEHHHHPADGPGAACVDCHMPERTYMVVDPRRDHSIRVPRPDLSVELGTPNACNGCHDDQDARWAADLVAEWFPEGRTGTPHWGQVFHAAREGRPEAMGGLVSLAVDPEQPSIVRATAISELGRRVDASGLQLIQKVVEDPDPLVRSAALGALEGQQPVQRMPVAFPHVEDPVRLVRLEAARALAEMPKAQLLGGGLEILDDALGEYEASLRVNADRADAQHGLGLFYSGRERPAAAEAAYRRGIELDPNYVPNHANLAELLRERGEEERSRRVLEAGIDATGDPALVHALGLALVRAGENEAALTQLERAADLAPAVARYAYVHAVALRESADPAGAIPVLQNALSRHPRDTEILHALITFLRDDGDVAGALHFAEQLALLRPGDPNVDALVEELRSAGGR